MPAPTQLDAVVLAAEYLAGSSMDELRKRYGVGRPRLRAALVGQGLKIRESFQQVKPRRRRKTDAERLAYERETMIKGLTSEEKRMLRLCCRCEIRLSEAPAGTGEMCGWCCEEGGATRGE
jgi:hypothetical protein